MTFVHPFNALLPHRGFVERIASLPYDVVSEQEARVIGENNPYSFLRITRSEIDLPQGTDPHSDEVYRKARKNFESFIENDLFELEETPCFYIYTLITTSHQQRGLACCYPVDRYDDGSIVKHEKTRPDKEEDRTRHLDAISAHPGPLFLAYRDTLGIDSLLDRESKSPPLFDFTTEDGVTHRIWKVSSKITIDLVSRTFESIPRLYIADGHHRAAAASRIRAERRANNPRHTGKEAYNFALGVLFPADQLHILPYNRIIYNLPTDPSTFLKDLTKDFEISETDQPRPRTKGKIHLYIGGKWWRTVLKPVEGSVLDRMDVNQLQKQILEPYLRIVNQRTDKNIDFIGGHGSIQRIEERIANGEAEMGISLYPTQIDEFLAVSDAGELMPPKSTWFDPKLRSGFFVHPFERVRIENVME